MLSPRLAFSFLFTAFCCFISIHAPAAVRATYYVDPAKGSDTNLGTNADSAFLTLEKAQEVVRKDLRTASSGDIVVNLRDGAYSLAKPLIFDSRDSGRPGTTVIYQAYQNEKPVISGGKIITGWTLHDPARKIWQADVGPNDQFDELYINGKRAERSSIGAPAGTVKNAQGYGISDPTLQNLKNIQDIDIVTGPHGWDVEHLRVATITADQITIQEPGWSVVRQGEYPGYGGITRLENAYEWLKEGQWYLDRHEHKLYYVHDGQDMNNLTVEAPILEHLINFQGTAAKPVSHVRFSGLAFRLTTWLEPSFGIGLIQTQANQITFKPGAAQNTPVPETPVGEGQSSAPKAAIGGTGMHNVTISHCTFSQMGGDGINILEASKDDTISRCEFHDLGASGIQIAGVSNVIAQLPVGSPDIVSGITVADCTIHHVNTEYPSGVGLMMGYTQGCTVSHNEIYDLPYTAISLGWGWTNKDQAAAYRTDNLFEGNKIHDIMLGMNDGGGIYCNGYEGSGTITKNYMYNIVHEGSLIYLDDGAANWVVKDNVLKAKNFNQDWYGYKGVNEQASDNYTDGAKISNMSDRNGAPSPVTNTIEVTDGNWPPAAQAIMDASGPRPENGQAHAP
jgi:hypothetical protein